MRYVLCGWCAMDEKKIIEEMQEYLNNRRDSFDQSLLVAADNSIEKYLAKRAFSLIETYAKYKDELAGEADYYVALRGFMKSFQTTLILDQFNLGRENSYGFHIEENHEVSVFLDLPNYIQHPDLVEQAFITATTPITEEKTSFQKNTLPSIRKLTGFAEFKSVEQKYCVIGALNTPKGYTTLICMPTGGGKSLVTQTLAFQSDGLTIVVVPTISLAIDQARKAKEIIKDNKEGEILCYYGGVKQKNEIFEALKTNKARMLFISPEALLKNKNFKDIIWELNESGRINNIVIDEAHIVIQWGDQFRVDYQCLEPWRRKLIEKNKRIRTFLLSATITDQTERYLRMMFSEGNNWIAIRCDALRQEPRFVTVINDAKYKKKDRAIEMIDRLPRPMILYVNSPDEAEEWKKILVEHGYINTRCYTGNTKNEERERIGNEWIQDKFDLMIATCAFGVGVDKADVRTVMHLYLPETPDQYYQELGRGGRDGLPSLSVVCIDEKTDIDNARSRVTKALTTEKFVLRWQTMKDNPDNIWSKSKYITIDTNVEPDYEGKRTYKYGNNTHRDWNINTLLMLRRHGKLEIEDINEEDGHCYIDVKVLDDHLLDHLDEHDEAFDRIRNKESNESYRAFNILVKAIENVNLICWSTMFSKIYPLTDFYCAGCNQHDEPDYEKSAFDILRDSISQPHKNIPTDDVKLFADSHEIIFQNNSQLSFGDIVAWLSKYHSQVVVTDQEAANVNCEVLIMDFQEFSNHLKNKNWYYVSGIVLVIYSTEASRMKKQYNLVRSALRNGNVYVIHVVNDDYIVGPGNKRISEVVNGIRRFL